MSTKLAPAPDYFTLDADLSEIRADEGEDGKRISGYAARFNSWSEDLGWFREQIDPEAFTRTLKSRNDIKALVNHDPSQVIGSTRAGTLELELDDKGLRDSVLLPDTTYANDLHTVVKRRDVSGQSFGFSVVRDEWNADGTERRLLEVRLHEVSIVTFPAYRATTASARMLHLLAKRTEQDVDALADAFAALQSGGELTGDQAALLVEAVDRSTAKPSEPEPEATVPLSLLQKQLDLVALSL